MDRLELHALRAELRQDCRVATEACQRAAERFDRREPAGYEACAHQLARLYNALEQMGLRVARAFENRIEDQKGWHGALLPRLFLAIPGVRPALFPPALKLPLNELKGFRHVFVHAYDLELDPEKLTLLMKYARQVTDALPGAVENFVATVAREQQIEL